MVDLLLHVDVSVVFVSLTILHGLDRLLILGLDLAENLLQLVKVEAAPRLQLAVVAIALNRAAIGGALVVVLFLAEHGVSNVPAHIRICRVEIID